MRKLIIALCAFFALSTAAFCETGWNLDLSSGVDLSGGLKPYIYLESGVDYEFESGFKLGAGIRGDVNILHQQYRVGDSLNSEGWVFGIPYLMLGYKGFSLEGGIVFSSESFESFGVPFVKIGGEVLFAEMEKGKLGIEFGAAYWPSLYLVKPETDDANAELGAGIGTVFLTLFNMVKVNVGVKYRLNI